MYRSLQKGLSLVELMISLTVGSVITAGVVQLFSANSDTYGVMMGQSRMQESARFSLDFIGRDIYKAGYFGCFSSNEQLHWTAADGDDIPYEFDLRSGLEGYNASVADRTWIPGLDDLPTTVGATNTNVFEDGTGINTDNIVSGTDVITIRSLSQQDVETRLAEELVNATDDIEVVKPDDGIELGINEGDLAMIHDCEKATIFQVTDIQVEDLGGTVEIDIKHDVDDEGVSWDNSFARLALKNSFGTDAYVSAIETNTYFIAPGQGENNSGDAPLSLWRKSGTTSPVELVEGIENLQILYGVSDDDDLIPNQYVSSINDVSLKNVVTIRVTVIANSIDDVGGSSAPTHGCTIQNCYEGEGESEIDGLIRRAFTQTFMLRNRS
jgi:type IV pilus assembly protein PilW